MCLGDGPVRERFRYPDPEDIQPLGDHQRVTAQKVVQDGVGPHRGEGEDEIGAGFVQDVNVALYRRSADNLNIRPQATAIDGQIDVHVVVVGGDDHRGRGQGYVDR